jgi:hypothetical protein
MAARAGDEQGPRRQAGTLVSGMADSCWLCRMEGAGCVSCGLTGLA